MSSIDLRAVPCLLYKQNNILNKPFYVFLMCNFGASKTEREHYVLLQRAFILHGLFGCFGDCLFSDCDFQENEALKWFMGDRLCLLLHHN